MNRAPESVVVVIRDPDASNDATVFGPPVEVYDVDLGYADLDDPDEFREWAASHLAWVIYARTSPDRSPARIGAADLVASVVAEERERRHADSITWAEVWKLAQVEGGACACCGGTIDEGSCVDCGCTP